MLTQVRIFAGSESEALAEKIAKSYGTSVGKRKLTRFSDGEFTVSFEESIRGQDVFIIQSTMPPSDNLFEFIRNHKKKLLIVHSRSIFILFALSGRAKMVNSTQNFVNFLK